MARTCACVTRVQVGYTTGRARACMHESMGLLTCMHAWPWAGREKARVRLAEERTRAEMDEQWQCVVQEDMGKQQRWW